MPSRYEQWVGLVEAIPVFEGDASTASDYGVFCTAVAWARDEGEFNALVTKALGLEGLFVIATEEVEPVRVRQLQFEIPDECLAAAREVSELHPVALCTLHRYPKGT
jgi:hypothetical protein